MTADKIEITNFAQATKRRGQDFTSGAYYGNTEPGVSVRPPMNREVYENFRPGESIPAGNTQEEHRKIMRMCKSAYERVGLVRSVIDMMSEFTAEGVEIIHPDAGPNAFYQEWAKKVCLEERAERFASWYYKAGNTVVRRVEGKIPKDKVRNYKSVLKFGGKGDVTIPVGYTFYDPSTIEVIGGGLAGLSAYKQYGLRVPLNIFDGVKTPKNAVEQKIFDNLPMEIKDAVKGNVYQKYSGLVNIPIDNKKLYVAFYKKDDSDIWGKSFIYSILDDIFANDKLQLAKTSALDGWYNVIRLWKLGDHKEKISPDPKAGERLAAILQESKCSL